MVQKHRPSASIQLASLIGKRQQDRAAQQEPGANRGRFMQPLPLYGGPPAATPTAFLRISLQSSCRFSTAQAVDLPGASRCWPEPRCESLCEQGVGNSIGTAPDPLFAQTWAGQPAELTHWHRNCSVLCWQQSSLRLTSQSAGYSSAIFSSTRRCT